MSNRVSVSVVMNQESIMQSLMIRAAVFVGEVGIPMEDAIDGNDFCATHVLAKVDEFPAGAMRLRFFNDIAVLERMSILKEYRKKRFGSRGVAWELTEFAINYCRMKGYTKFFGSSREGLVKFWEKTAPPGCEFVQMDVVSEEYSGHVSLPMKGTAVPLNHPVPSLDRIDLLTMEEARLPAALCERH